MEQASFDFDVNPEPIIETLPVSPARRTDPETAHLAAAANEEVRGAQRLRVLKHYQACGPEGSTDYETGVALGILRTSAGKRRKELCERGLIKDSRQRRDTDTGSTAIVWVINES